MIELKFDNHRWQIDFTGFKADYKIDFALSDIERIYEHESTVSDENLIKQLIDSFNSEGFLHPILVTVHDSDYVIADGTHRYFALRNLSSKSNRGINVFLNVLKQPYFSRTSWVFKFDKEVDLASIRKKRYEVEEVKLGDFNEKLSLVLRGEAQALVKTREKFFMIYKHFGDRYNFLKSLKELDALLGDYSELVLPDRLSSLPADMVLLSPPSDAKGDISLLVENKELRRKKASKTIVGIRPLFFDIPLEKLYQEQGKLRAYIIRKIDDAIASNKLILLKPPVWGLDFCNDQFDQTLLIMNKDIFYKNEKVKENFKRQIIEDYTVS